MPGNAGIPLIPASKTVFENGSRSFTKKGDPRKSRKDRRWCLQSASFLKILRNRWEITAYFSDI
jgi:hypothetical protein